MKGHTGTGEEAAAAPPRSTSSRKLLLIQTLLRINVVLLTIVVITVMVNAKQTKIIPILGIRKAKWSNSKAFISLVAISAIALGYSFLQILLSLVKFQSSSFVWVNFVLDQVLTYALLGSAAASSELAYLAKNGAPAAGWSEVCSLFDTFCTRAGAAVILGFIAVLPMGLSAAISAYHLFKHNL